eukprot:TRINITY_DN2671_c0_g1_i1.p2 TRINITY_DN2671_c0_g1~~TRINITY_DN2671_c0_g1_i1.p2  ORF type:complete len:417 (+),score=95.43 TRINITY_DN2671_c0_g1_i1:86-1336(+)
MTSIKTPPAVVSGASTTTRREANNWLMHTLYVRQEFDECFKVVDKQLQTCPQSEYALYIKALIKRQKGEITESLQLFQQATALNPQNVANLKQVGRSLYLLGRHRTAIEMYDEAQKLAADDWEILHNKGLCYIYLKQLDQAIDCFKRANAIQKHDATFMQLGKAFTLKEDFKAAIDVYKEALEYSPESPELLTTLGLLYLRLGENFLAFDFLGNSLTHDPRNAKTILAAGSIIQDHNDMDVALVKYRIAAVQTPNSAQLWNNIGMCFFGKQRHIAAIACLKRAMFLAPFEWIIAYNLGLVHLNTRQYASAFHFLSASINLKSDFASSYMYLAVALAHLDDFDNACQAYEKALELEGDHVFNLNYAVTLYNKGEYAKAKHHFAEFERAFNELDKESRDSDPDVQTMRNTLSTALSKV